SLGSLILCYIFMLLSSLFFLRWLVDPTSKRLLLLCFGFSILAAFTREEAYTLPVVLLLLWFIRRQSDGCLQDACTIQTACKPIVAVALIMAIHFLLRWAFIQDAPQASLSMGSLRGLWSCLQSAWLPGGLKSAGEFAYRAQLLWISFIAVISGIFL